MNDNLYNDFEEDNEPFTDEMYDAIDAISESVQGITETEGITTTYTKSFTGGKEYRIYGYKAASGNYYLYYPDTKQTQFCDNANHFLHSVEMWKPISEWDKVSKS